MCIDTKQMEELKAIEVEMLKEFIKVCDRLHVKYYLLGGTLLGAVRHDGFIPWDDDIDVGMMREDYEIFVTEAQKHLPENLFVQTYKTDPQFPQNFAKIRNSNTAFIETSVCKRKMNHGIFIDIFPLDWYPDHKETFFQKLKKRIIGCRISYGLKGIPQKLSVRIFRIFSLLCYPSMHRALDAREKMHVKEKDTGRIANYCGAWGKKEIVPREWYGEGTELRFEGIVVTAPTEYEKWLAQVYGDYMKLPPEDKRVTHHYTKVIDTEKSYLEYLR